MDRLKIDFSSFNYTSVKASDVNLQDCGDHPVLDTFGNVYYFFGQLAEIEHGYKAKSLRNCDIGSSKLIQVLGGHLFQVGTSELIRVLGGNVFHVRDFAPQKDTNLEVKVLEDYRVVLPDRGASKFYGVVTNPQERDVHKDLTRSIFGLTQDELNNFLYVFSSLFQSFSAITHKPCTTSSNLLDNVCELSGRWIPLSFPYVSYDDINHSYAHISLAGFYALVSLLCLDRDRNRSCRKLTENGISEELLDEILEANFVISSSEIFSCWK